MPATAFTSEEARAAEIELVEGGGGGHAVHQVVTAMQANRRSGTAQAKTRAEVKGSGKKPWRQKGTGRARAGRVTSPIWRGGGVVFGPRNRDYSKDVNRSTRRLAFRAALSSRIGAGEVLIADAFVVEDGKTRTFMDQLDQIGAVSKKVLIVAAGFDDRTYWAARNVKPVLLMTADQVNTEHLVGYDTIVLTADSLPTLARRTRK